ncbi:FK506-binding protein 4-like [Carassius gibelio]|uniref:FK506-binding protein 4-like n=1 Tax=Carassius gibelio TaxID=101364 RepID=UPI00227847FA|nr:FK506-binding protein 4-like [Carassius gibelio]
MTERFNRRLRRLREHHAICEQRHRRNSAKDGMKTSHQDGQKRDEEDLDGQKRDEEDLDGQKRDEEDLDGQKRDEEDQDGQNDFIQEICIEVSHS